MKKQRNLRSMAAQAIEQVVEQGQSLSNILPPLQQKVSDKDKALLQELCFGVLRTLSQLDWLINKLMARPMTGKQRTVHYLIMVGLYQLLYTRIPPHAALAETVEGAVAIKRPQLKGLINGVLRLFQRQQDELLVCNRRIPSSGKPSSKPITSVRQCGCALIVRIIPATAGLHCWMKQE